MNYNQTKNNSGSNTKKLMVIGLLACFLAVVLWQNFRGKSAEPVASLVSVSAPLPTTTTGTRLPLAQALANWPTVELPQLLAHNPFQTLELLSDTDTSTSGDRQSSSLAGARMTAAQAAHASQQTGLTGPIPSDHSIQVNAILSGGPRPAVLIGQQLYFEQDEVAGQWRVISIEPNRVSLLPLATDEAGETTAAEPVSVHWSANRGQAPYDDQSQ